MRLWQVLLGQVLAAAGERRGQEVEEGGEGVLDGDGAVVDAERRRQQLGVGARALARVARRHRHAVDVLGAEGVGGDAGHERRVDATGEADHDVGEAVLAHVVAGADHQRLVHLGDRVEGRGHDRSAVVVVGDGALGEHHLGQGLGADPAPRVEEALAEDRPHVEIHHQHRLGELRGPGHQLAVGVEHHGGPVEDQLVLAADLVHVDEGAGRIGGPGGEHALARRQPVGEVRRGVHVHDQLGTAEALEGDRAVRAPGVLADADADPHAPDHVELGPLGTGREVPLLVEHGVVRQQPLAVDAGHLPADADGGGVVEVAPGVDEADDGRAPAGAGGHLGQGGAVVGHEPGLEHQVLGGVAGDGQLGEGSQVGPGRLGLVQRPRGSGPHSRRGRRQWC